MGCLCLHQLVITKHDFVHVHSQQLGHNGPVSRKIVCVYVCVCGEGVEKRFKYGTFKGEYLGEIQFFCILESDNFAKKSDSMSRRENKHNRKMKEE